jgi:hypothetical protein
MDNEKVMEIMSVKPEKDTTKVHVASEFIQCSPCHYGPQRFITGLGVSLWASVLSAFPILYAARGWIFSAIVLIFYTLVANYTAKLLG